MGSWYYISGSSIMGVSLNFQIPLFGSNVIGSYLSTGQVRGCYQKG